MTLASRFGYFWAITLLTKAKSTDLTLQDEVDCMLASMGCLAHNPNLNPCKYTLFCRPEALHFVFSGSVKVAAVIQTCPTPNTEWILRAYVGCSAWPPQHRRGLAATFLKASTNHLQGLGVRDETWAWRSKNLQGSIASIGHMELLPPTHQHSKAGPRSFGLRVQVPLTEVLRE